jgi:methylated-DNA-[protein]-cysteine S-methyltransferase
MRMERRELRAMVGGFEDRSRELGPALAERARAEGLVDVAYGFADSPLGRLLLVLADGKLVTLGYPNEDVDEQLAAIARQVSPRILELPSQTDGVRRELDEYFEGRRRRFSVPVDLRLRDGFTRRVLEETARIPFGTVVTYKAVAGGAGNPRASRAAGNALGSNPIPIVVPCHRVVHTGGGLGGYTGGLDRKVTLLRLEGVLNGE